ncbi:MAG TPA: hypothetical protein VF014_00600, partial [Casimicrobiaceae bacterium]|nr:hypothetical protein [Casimicrobiaceae bacterium]
AIVTGAGTGIGKAVALALLDGSRTRAEIAAAMADGLPASGAATSEERVDEYLRQFSKHGFLLG